MKRATFLLSIILLVSLVLPPFAVSAADYSVSQTDVTVTIDDTFWYVFTRDNLKDNPELDELGITYDYLYNSMQTNSVYIDAILFYDDGNYIEMFLRKTTNGALDNLSDLSDDAVDVFAQALTENLGLDSYTIYETDYTYVLMEYIDQGLYLYEFFTIVDGDNYSFTFQASSAYTASEYEEMKGIVDSAKFGADSASDNNNSQNNSASDNNSNEDAQDDQNNASTDSNSGAETEENQDNETSDNNSDNENSQDEGLFDGVFGGALKGALIGGGVGLIIGLIGNAKKKKAKAAQAASEVQEPQVTASEANDT